MILQRALVCASVLLCATSTWSRPLAVEPAAPARAPRIQMAILLDTSNSMDGLIDQARNQLWQVVGAFARASRDGVAPTLEVAVIEYGNAGLPAQRGHVRQVVGLTSDLDRVSEALFGLSTNGGDEYCGYAIDVAARELQWSTSSDDIRAIFIAGNEPFTQGPVPFARAIDAAKRRGIVVNTIHAGPQEQGVAGQWLAGAQLAGGHFLAIDADRKTVHIPAPQDDQLAELNRKLNETYVPFGKGGPEAKERQVAQDERSRDISGALLAKRAAAKASSYYDGATSSWDLVSAVEQGTVKLEELKESELPEPLRQLPPVERAPALRQKKQERLALQKQIQKLGAERDAHVASERLKQASDGAESLDDALIGSVVEQGKRKGFTFEAEAGRP